MGDRQWPDPQGWEALTQAEAEQDEGWQFTSSPITDDDCPCLKPSHSRLAEALAVAERERDQAREALRRMLDANDPMHRVPGVDDAGNAVAGYSMAQQLARAALAEGPQT